MYDSSETSTRIKKLAKEKGIQMLELQEKCGLSKNTIMQSGKSQEGMKAKNLYAIAEMLECSVDYLLGRTDNPNITTDTYINGNNNGIQAVNNGNNSNLTVNNNARSDTEELVEMIQGLPLVQRAKIITQIDEMKNKR